MGRRTRTSNDTQRANLKGGFVALPYGIIDSPAWRAISPFTRALLIEIARAHNGYNNGSLVRSQRQLAEALGTTNFRAISRSVAEAMQLGFLALEAEGTRWTRQAREYRLTWLPTGQPPHQTRATEDWRAFSSDDAVSAARAVRADTASADRKFPVEAVSAARMKKRQKTVGEAQIAADAVSPHI